MGRLPTRLVLTPEDTVEGTSVRWESAEQYSLSAPIIQVSCADLIDDEKMAGLKEVFKQWVQIDRENCDLVRKGLQRFRMPHSYRTNEAPPGSIVEVGLRAPEPEFMKRGIQTLAESAECVGGQLGNLDDPSGALRAALLVDHLTTKYPQIFANLPRWRGTRIPADLGTNVVQALNKFIEDQGGTPYLYRGIDEVQKALDNDPLVKRFLASKTGTK
jgi:hypothetical protein